jgi:hypothetical protein
LCSLSSAPQLRKLIRQPCMVDFAASALARPSSSRLGPSTPVLRSRTHPPPSAEFAERATVQIGLSASIGAAAQCRYVAGRAVAVTDPGELPLRPLAAAVGSCTPDRRPLAAPYGAPAAIGRRASFQGFNLVRIECQFNVPIPLTGYRHGHFAPDGRPFKIEPFWKWPSRMLGGESCANLPAFSPKRAGVRRSSATSDHGLCI